jgi:4-amino-4-deoxy-L-arabinose transferase-like glycosyltransferase
LSTPNVARTGRQGVESFAVAAVALAARAATLVWAGDRFGPAADGIYYHRLAARISQGLGSTWQWPDGAVTYAAHYPIGYPGLLALAYRIGGPSAFSAGAMNALVGTLGAVAAHRLAVAVVAPRWALVAGLAVALHPALVLYTPALMTEGVTAALVAGAAYLASRARRGTGGRGRAVLLLGMVLGVATLVRPQVIVLAPWLGLLACPAQARWPQRIRRAAMATIVAVCVCLPWTARNCARMGRCALVSMNGGWNLLIGTNETAAGTFAPIEVPPRCRTVWDEADKDVCFGREARNIILRAPASWIALVPRKLAATFDYSGGPGFYLHESNPEAFGLRAKRAVGVVETVYERLAYLLALVGAARFAGPRRRARIAIALLGAACLFGSHAYLAVLALAIVLSMLGRTLLCGPTLLGASLAAILATAAAHSIFFGSGRYSMVVFPLVTVLAVAALTGPSPGSDNDPSEEEPEYAPD